MNSEVHKAQTEAIFRDVNERIAESVERFDAKEATFVCECSDRSCTERVDASLEEYEQVRADATHFLVAPGHEDAAIERVVGRRPGLAVVEKATAAMAVVVRRLDPRAGTA